MGCFIQGSLVKRNNGLGLSYSTRSLVGGRMNGISVDSVEINSQCLLARQSEVGLCVSIMHLKGI